MLPFKLVYHKGYDLNLGEHVFPSQKFHLIAETLVREGVAAPGDYLTPQPAGDEDILRVHTEAWVQKLKTGTLSASEIMKLEIPYSREAVEACWLAAGGSNTESDRKSTRLNSSHPSISYAVFCLKKKKVVRVLV